MTPPARGAHGESSSTGFYPDCEHREMTPGEAFIDLDADGAVFIVGREPVQHVGYLADDVMREFVDAFNALSGRDPAKVAALLEACRDWAYAGPGDRLAATVRKTEAIRALFPAAPEVGDS